MPTITINSVDYEVYADEAAATEYLAADVLASTWADAAELDKQRALVTATRLLDRFQWAGEKAEDDQPLAWPRTGTAIPGVEDDTVPLGIINASIELARYLVVGTDVKDGTTGVNNIRSQRAGSVAIEYVSPALLDAPTRFPLPVQELIAPFIGSIGVGGIITSGTCGESVTNEDFRPGVNF